MQEKILIHSHTNTPILQYSSIPMYDLYAAISQEMKVLISVLGG